MWLSLIEHLVNPYQTFYIPVVLYYNDCLYCKSAGVKRIKSLLSLDLSGSLSLCGWISPASLYAVHGADISRGLLHVLDQLGSLCVMVYMCGQPQINCDYF